MTLLSFAVSTTDLICNNPVHLQALNDSNPLIQAVLADPHVQSCLVDARIRRALETLVVNPQNAAALMSDPIVRDVILFLSQLIARVS